MVMVDETRQCNGVRGGRLVNGKYSLTMTAKPAVTDNNSDNGNGCKEQRNVSHDPTPDACDHFQQRRGLLLLLLAIPETVLRHYRHLNKCMLNKHPCVGTCRGYNLRWSFRL